jgi:hypothetical protein
VSRSGAPSPRTGPVQRIEQARRVAAVDHIGGRDARLQRRSDVRRTQAGCQRQDHQRREHIGVESSQPFGECGLHHAGRSVECPAGSGGRHQERQARRQRHHVVHRVGVGGRKPADGPPPDAATGPTGFGAARSMADISAQFGVLLPGFARDDHGRRGILHRLLRSRSWADEQLRVVDHGHGRWRQPG